MILHPKTSNFLRVLFILTSLYSHRDSKERSNLMRTSINRITIWRSNLRIKFSWHLGKGYLNPISNNSSYQEPKRIRFLLQMAFNNSNISKIRNCLNLKSSILLYQTLKITLINKLLTLKLVADLGVNYKKANRKDLKKSYTAKKS